MTADYSVASNASSPNVETVTGALGSDLVPPWDSGIARAVRVSGIAGDVQIETFSGGAKTIPNVQIGETIYVLARRVYATGTTAEGVTVFE